MVFIRIVVPLLVLLAPFACGCGSCDYSFVCISVAAGAAGLLSVLLGVVHELRLLASLANLR